MATKVLPFMTNYERELRIGGDMRKKGKIESTTEFIKRIKQVQEETRAVLKKTQEEMKRYADRSRREIEEWKKGDRVMLSTKDLVFKEKPVWKLTKRYMGPYEIEEVVSLNVVKLQLPSLMRIHLVINISRVVQYRKQMKGQKKEEGKPIEVEGIEEWKVEKILNKRKIRGVKKYLVHQKRFTAEHDSWVKKEKLGNMREVLVEFEERMEAEVRRQEKINRVEKRDFRRGKLPEKFIARMLYRWDNRNFKEEYLKKLEKNWKRQKAVSSEEKP